MSGRRVIRAARRPDGSAVTAAPTPAAAASNPFASVAPPVAANSAVPVNPFGSATSPTSTTSASPVHATFGGGSSGAFAAQSQSVNLFASTPPQGPASGSLFGSSSTGTAGASLFSASPASTTAGRQSQGSSLFGSSSANASGAWGGESQPPSRREVCGDWLKGRCMRGDLCTFAHDKSNEPTCRDWLKGLCTRGDGCRFKHDDLLCVDFRRGRCAKGDQCKFKHEETQQQQQQTSAAAGPTPPGGLSSAAPTRPAAIAQASSLFGSQTKTPPVVEFGAPSFGSTSVPTSAFAARVPVSFVVFPSVNDMQLDCAALESVLSAADVHAEDIAQLDPAIVAAHHATSAAQDALPALSSPSFPSALSALPLRELHWLLLQLGASQAALTRASRADKEAALTTILPAVPSMLATQQRGRAEHRAAEAERLSADEQDTLVEQVEAMLRIKTLDVTKEQLFTHLPTGDHEQGDEHDGEDTEDGSAAAAKHPQDISTTKAEAAPSWSSASASSASVAPLLFDGAMDSSGWMSLQSLADHSLVRTRGVSVSHVRAAVLSSPWLLLSPDGSCARARRRAELMGNGLAMLSPEQAAAAACLVGAMAHRHRVAAAAAAAAKGPLGATVPIPSVTATPQDLLSHELRQMDPQLKSEVVSAVRWSTALTLENASDKARHLIRWIKTDAEQQARCAQFTLREDSGRPKIAPQPSSAFPVATAGGPSFLSTASFGTSFPSTSAAPSYPFTRTVNGDRTELCMRVPRAVVLRFPPGAVQQWSEQSGASISIKPKEWLGNREIAISGHPAHCEAARLKIEQCARAVEQAGTGSSGPTTTAALTPFGGFSSAVAPSLPSSAPFSGAGAGCASLDVSSGGKCFVRTAHCLNQKAVSVEVTQRIRELARICATGLQRTSPIVSRDLLGTDPAGRPLTITWDDGTLGVFEQGEEIRWHQRIVEAAATAAARPAQYNQHVSSSSASPSSGSSFPLSCMPSDFSPFGDCCVSAATGAFGQPATEEVRAMLRRLYNGKASPISQPNLTCLHADHPLPHPLTVTWADGTQSLMQKGAYFALPDQVLQAILRRTAKPLSEAAGGTIPVTAAAAAGAADSRLGISIGSATVSSAAPTAFGSSFGSGFSSASRAANPSLRAASDNLAAPFPAAGTVDHAVRNGRDYALCGETAADGSWSPFEAMLIDASPCRSGHYRFSQLLTELCHEPSLHLWTREGNIGGKPATTKLIPWGPSGNNREWAEAQWRQEFERDTKIEWRQRHSAPVTAVAGAKWQYLRRPEESGDPAVAGAPFQQPAASANSFAFSSASNVAPTSACLTAVGPAAAAPTIVAQAPETVCYFHPSLPGWFVPPPSTSFKVLPGVLRRAISVALPEAPLRPAMLYIVPVCSAQDIEAEEQASSKQKKGCNKRTMVDDGECKEEPIAPSSMGSASARSAASVTAGPSLSSSCSFSVRICAINRFQRLQIGFRQNSVFARTHLLQLTAAIEGAATMQGHGQIDSKRNAKKLRTEMTAGDSLFEDDDEIPAAKLPPATSADRFSGPLMCRVDSLYRDRANATVLQDADGVWDAHVTTGQKHTQFQLLQIDRLGTVQYGVGSRDRTSRVEGRHQLKLCPTLDAAKGFFRNKFNGITGNDWEDRQHCVKMGNYTYEPREYAKVESASASSASSASTVSAASSAVSSAASSSASPVADLPPAGRVCTVPGLRVGSVLTCRYDRARNEIRFSFNGAELPDATIRSVLTRHAQPAGWDVSALHAMLPVLLLRGSGIEVECVAEEEGAKEAKRIAEKEREAEDKANASASSLTVPSFDSSSLSTFTRGSSSSASFSLSPSGSPLRDLSGDLALLRLSERAVSGSSSSERDHHAEQTALVECPAAVIPAYLRLLMHDWPMSRALGLPYFPLAILDVMAGYIHRSAPQLGSRGFGFMRCWAPQLRGQVQPPADSRLSAADKERTVAWMFEPHFPFASRQLARVGALAMLDATDDPIRSVYHSLSMSGEKAVAASQRQAQQETQAAQRQAQSLFVSPVAIVKTPASEADEYCALWTRFADRHPDQIRAEDYAALQIEADEDAKATLEMIAEERREEDASPSPPTLFPAAESLDSREVRKSAARRSVLTHARSSPPVIRDEDGAVVIESAPPPPPTQPSSSGRRTVDPCCPVALADVLDDYDCTLGYKPLPEQPPKYQRLQVLWSADRFMAWLHLWTGDTSVARRMEYSGPSRDEAVRVFERYYLTTTGSSWSSRLPALAAGDLQSSMWREVATAPALSAETIAAARAQPLQTATPGVGGISSGAVSAISAAPSAWGGSNAFGAATFGSPAASALSSASSFGGAFGSQLSAMSVTPSCCGTRWRLLIPLIEVAQTRDPFSGRIVQSKNIYQSITAMPQYEQFTFEELREQDERIGISDPVLPHGLTTATDQWSAAVSPSSGFFSQQS